MGRDRDILDRRARLVGQLLALQAGKHLDEILRARLVVEIADRRQHIGRIGSDARLERDRNVDDAARHALSRFDDWPEPAKPANAAI